MTFSAPAFDLPDEASTTRLARRLAPRLRPGDTILLHGPIGVGKSHFARSLIRARLGNPAEEVPSPTFTIVQTYPDDAGDIWHCDLYRLGSTDELIELGLEEAFATAICLVEWPDRLGTDRPDHALDLHLSISSRGHQAEFRGPDPWAKRLGDLLE